jgi:DNA-binding transcriptional ArsR family regulator
MAFSKKTEFRIKDTRLSEFAGALSHPARIAILKVLTECTTCVCGDLVDRMPLAQSTVSQHLRVLKEVGLITGEIDGPRCNYCVDPKVLAELTALMDELLSQLRPHTKKDKCC